MRLHAAVPVALRRGGIFEPGAVGQPRARGTGGWPLPAPLPGGRRRSAPAAQPVFGPGGTVAGGPAWSPAGPRAPALCGRCAATACAQVAYCVGTYFERSEKKS
jgi:hypothetical protein